MVRHSTLTAIFAGSNPVSPACLSIDRQKLYRTNIIYVLP